MSSIKDYMKMTSFGMNPQGAATDYTSIPYYTPGKGFPANLGKGHPAFDANSMNYGGFNGTDTMTNFLDTNKGFGTYAAPETPGMWDSIGKFWGENKGTWMGTKDAPGIIPGATGFLGSLASFGQAMSASSNAKKALAHSKDVFAANFEAARTGANREVQREASSSAGMGGMSRQEAEAYGKQYAAANGVQAYKGA